MYIVQVASEVAPIAKVGGLADVMMGLNHDLQRKGHTVDIVIPKYDCIDTKELTFELVQNGVRSHFQGGWHENTIWRAKLANGMKITFVESHHPNCFFERGSIYGCHDDIDRFLTFSRTVLDWLLEQDRTPDIIHIHDWETAAIAFMIRESPYKKRFEKTRTVLTIHNIAYQGQCQVSDLDRIGLHGAWYNGPERLLEDFGTNLNLLKGGIVFADHTTTVSPTYAKEVLTPEGGKGLQLTLDENLHKFSGILNGLDYSYWNPATDPLIPFQYSVSDRASGKEKNKKALLEELKLGFDPKKPLVVAVTRLVQQKGVDQIKHALLSSHDKGMQCVILGTAPDPAIHYDFMSLEAQFKDDPDVKILLGQEEKLAHKLYAAADIFLVPSLFEPCGLTQLIALKYGAIPVVRMTGGLLDTVFDVDYSGRPFEETNGFSFETPDNQGLDSALDRAVLLWKNNPTRWSKLVSQAMECDYSWGVSSGLYEEVYQKILSAVKE